VSFLAWVLISGYVELTSNTRFFAEDSQVMVSVIFRLTNMTELPILLYRGSVVGAAETIDTVENGTEMLGADSATYIERIRSLNETGALRRLLARESRVET
jgi:hypothetical protein